MSIERGLPFERGSTHFGGQTPTDDAASSAWEGREFEVDDIIYTPGATKGTWRSQEKVVLRIVRNVSGGVLYPKRLVQWKVGYEGKRVDSYARIRAQAGIVPVDEYLPSTGVANNDLFYVVVSGPAVCMTPGVTLAGANPVQGAVVISQTDSAANGTTTNATSSAGRFVAYTASIITGDQTTYDAVNNWFGRMMSSGTSGQTHSDFLVRIRRW